MKANEAPEKIYLTPLECMTASCQPKKDNTIEYTRTDAFIKKAYNAYCNVCKMPNCRSNECKWVSDFKGHLQTI